MDRCVEDLSRLDFFMSEFQDEKIFFAVNKINKNV